MLRRFSSNLFRPLLVSAAGLLAASLLCADARGAVPTDLSERPIGPGVRLLRWTDPAGPNTLTVVEADLGQPLIRVGVSYGRGGTLGLEPLSQQAARLARPERYPIAGVNGDFFYYPDKKQPGIPTNALIADGELIGSPFTRSCLVLDPSGAPSIQLLGFHSRVARPDGVERSLTAVNHPRGPNQLVLFTPRFGTSTRSTSDGVEVYLEPERFPFQHGVDHKATVRAVQAAAGDAPINPGCWVLSGSGPAADFLRGLNPGDALALRADFEPALSPGHQVLGGGPRILRDGKVAVEPEGGAITGSFAKTRHPRTAIGFAGKKLIMLVVDGRQPGYSMGMSLEELGKAMLAAGCTDALNMDGGGSTTLWVRGSIANRPSDGRERPVANGLLVFSTAPMGEPVRLVPSLDEIRALPGAEVPVSFAAEDEHFNPRPLPEGSLKLELDPALGEVRDGRMVLRSDAPVPPGQEFVLSSVRAEAGRARGELPIRIYAKPARLELTPRVARLGPLSRASFTVKAFDSTGRPLLMPPGVEWDVTPEVGRIDPSGTLASAGGAARGMLTARVAGVTAMAQVEVSPAVASAFEDFEKATDWTAAVAPAGIPGTAVVAEGLARSGKKALKLEYDFSSGMGTRAVYALGERVLGQPLALKLWAYGDGQGAWLRLRVRDAKGEPHLLDAARKIDWKGSWKELRVPLSEDFPGPLKLEAIYVVEIGNGAQPKGAILIDDLTLE